MKFLDKISLNKKLVAISVERNKRTWELRETIHPLWVMLAPYLGLVYQGIADDPKCRDILNVLANTDSASLNQISKILVFWFFWSLDRKAGYKDLLLDSKTKEYFLKIWSMSNLNLQKLIEFFDNSKDKGFTNIIWKSICDELGVERLYSFAYANYVGLIIGNAQDMVLKPGMLEKLHGF